MHVCEMRRVYRCKVTDYLGYETHFKTFIILHRLFFSSSLRKWRTSPFGCFQNLKKWHYFGNFCTPLSLPESPFRRFCVLFYICLEYLTLR